MNSTATTRPDRIVVVDDDARIRDLLRRYLSQEGFEVLLAEDAKALNRVMTRETVDFDTPATRATSMIDKPTLLRVIRDLFGDD